MFKFVKLGWLEESFCFEKSWLSQSPTSKLYLIVGTWRKDKEKKKERLSMDVIMKKQCNIANEAWRIMYSS